MLQTFIVFLLVKYRNDMFLVMLRYLFIHFKTFVSAIQMLKTRMRFVIAEAFY